MLKAENFGKRDNRGFDRYMEYISFCLRGRNIIEIDRGSGFVYPPALVGSIRCGIWPPIAAGP